MEKLKLNNIANLIKFALPKIQGQLLYLSFLGLSDFLGFNSRLVVASAFLKKRSSPKERPVRKRSRNLSKSVDYSLNREMTGRTTLTKLAILPPIPEAKIL
jgi:hypothetical protein